MNYAVVPKPTDRLFLNPQESFFSIYTFPSWFSSSASLLGTRWSAGTASSWSGLEPDRPGQYAEARAAAPNNIRPTAQRLGATIGETDAPWVNYQWQATYRTKASMTWAIDPTHAAPSRDIGGGGGGSGGTCFISTVASDL